MSFFQRLFSSNSSPPSAPPVQTQLPSSSDPSLSPNSSTATGTTPQTNTQPSPSQQSRLRQPPSSPPSSSSFLSPLQKQISYVLTGVAFVSLSALVTRRSITRRRISLIPRFYHFSHDSPPPHFTGGAKKTIEALNIATINVLSHTIFWTSGLVWAFDIRGMDDLRAKCKKATKLEGVDVKAAEEEFEEWLKKAFAGKEGDRDKRRNEKEEG